MGRLITEEAVIDVLKQTGIIQDNDLGHCVIDEIKRIPTAYDVDTVVEELEDKMYESASAHTEAVIGMSGVSANLYYGEKLAFEKAIEIVRKGGVNV